MDVEGQAAVGDQLTTGICFRSPTRGIWWLGSTAVKCATRQEAPPSSSAMQTYNLPLTCLRGIGAKLRVEKQPYSRSQSINVCLRVFFFKLLYLGGFWGF